MFCVDTIGNRHHFLGYSKQAGQGQGDRTQTVGPKAERKEDSLGERRECGI